MNSELSLKIFLLHQEHIISLRKSGLHEQPL